ncbi:TetR/AcrR family transcriptional regulator [Salinactinospora qingdaonensis]|uniref:TetR/AcrR family transcriptional regulator n=1 Tax=Salinactinospora qingdaonensis TaxID=702744 RepID=A0ABP7G8Z2_9ACTN
MATSAGPRARYREQTRTEIKQVALRQLAEGGLPSIALTRIAKELGLSGPALYRYFANRDDLVSALIRDAYDDMAAALNAAVPAEPHPSPRNLLYTLARCYRAWVLDHPHRYLLIAGSPLPGYSAPPDTLARARAALGPFVAVFEHADPQPAVAALVASMTAWVRDDPDLATWVRGHAPTAQTPEAAGQAMAGAVLAWTRGHGAVSLEVSGQFEQMGHNPRALFEVEVDTLADIFGLD